MVDWRSLVDGRTDGLSTAVHGLRVGDAVHAVLLDRATSIEPAKPSSPSRSWGSAGVFEVDAEGRSVLVPRETLIAELRQYGGRVWVDRVSYQVSSGRIEGIRVRGTALGGLHLGKDEDIERTLGPSIGVERTLGWIVHHFPERSLSVAWDTREGCIEHVALGPVDWRPPVFGAADVLREWVAASGAGLAPAWEEPADRSSSTWVRYGRVTALLRAFHLGSPKAFSEGEFLEGRPLSAYPLAAAALETGPWQREGDRGLATYPDALGRLFWWLLHYRTTAQKLLDVNAGWLVAGHPGILTAIDVTKEANEGVAEAIADVEVLLHEMIAPGGEHVPEREMIARWGWPEVDLEDLLSSEL
jgi:hypothetical protein